ncbi:MAG TPA: tetratricopeptide repeat protein [Ktedonobacteraceae bacterium]|nr:tetratricopeptide repeat protein [Ktedonobacteraceae bacterium]
MSHLAISLEQAHLACLHNDYETAYRLYDELLRDFPNDPEVLLSYGRAKYREFVDLEQAASLFLQAVEADPCSIEALLWLGDVSGWGYGPGYAKAADFYRRVLEREPESIDAWTGLAMMYKAPSSAITLGEAIDAYRKAVELDPRNPDTYQNLGFILLEAEQPDEALEAFQKAQYWLKLNGQSDAAANMLKVIEQIRNHQPVKRRAYVKNSQRYRWLS